jgi:hypothetical protein
MTRFRLNYQGLPETDGISHRTTDGMVIVRNDWYDPFSSAERPND